MATRTIAFMGLVAGFCLVGCGGSQQVVKDPNTVSGTTKVKGDRHMLAHSEGLEPLWIQECPIRSAQVLPFCGEGQRQSSQATACASANADALEKLRRMIGQSVNASLVPDGKGGYRFEIKGAEAEPLTVRGAWEDQRWYEEYQGPDGKTYDCYVMLTYPKLEYDNLIGLSRKANMDRVEKAAALLKEGQKLSADGHFGDAVERLKRAQGLISGMKEEVVAGDGSNSTLLAEQISADLNKSEQEAKKTSDTALVVIHLVLDGKTENEGGPAAQSVLNRVKKMLADKGIRIRPGGLKPADVELVLSGDTKAAANTAAQKGAGLLLVLDLDSQFKGQDANIFYAYARGAFRLIRTLDGREIHAADLGPEKGALMSREDAVQKALDNLCKRFLPDAVSNALSNR